MLGNPMAVGSSLLNWCYVNDYAFRAMSAAGNAAIRAPDQELKARLKAAESELRAIWQQARSLVEQERSFAVAVKDDSCE
jgi:hypothetical protein